MQWLKVWGGLVPSSIRWLILQVQYVWCFLSLSFCSCLCVSFRQEHIIFVFDSRIFSEMVHYRIFVSRLVLMFGTASFCRVWMFASSCSTYVKAAPSGVAMHTFLCRRYIDQWLDQILRQLKAKNWQTIHGLYSCIDSLDQPFSKTTSNLLSENHRKSGVSFMFVL